MRRHIAILLIAVMGGGGCLAQTDYEVKAKRHWPIWALGTSAAAAAFFIDAQSAPPSGDHLDASRVFILDRRILPRPNHGASVMSDGLLLASLAGGGVMALAADPEQRLVRMGVWGGSLLLTGGITQLTKALARRARPSAYRLKAEGRPLAEEEFRSFFSGHTALAMASAACGSVLWLNSRKSDWELPAVAFTLAAGCGVCRVLGGHHFVTDVITGAVVGSALGLLMPRWHEKAQEIPGSSPMTLHFQFRF